MTPRTPSPVPPFRSRDADRLLVSYAQAGEDIRLARVLWDRQPGFYVDVGAGDPVTDSVTKLFYDAGWRGINVEPGPAYERLVLARPHDVNLRLAVGVKDGKRDFWVSHPHAELSSFTRRDAAALPAGTRLERLRVSCRRLDAILEEHGHDQPIDFLKIDVEGAEREVLESIDLRRFRPLVLVIESIEPLARTPSHPGWEDLVLDAEYALAAFDGINRFYVPREEEELRDVLGYPLSPLDLFVRKGHADGVRFEAAPESSEFPTLSDELAEPQSEGVPSSPLVVLLEEPEAIAAISRIVPPGSEVFAVDADRPAAMTLTDVRAVLTRFGHDVLVVSDARIVGRPTLETLRATLALDSSCATVSIDDGATSTPAGVPATPVDRPRKGVVLVRRDHLGLALDEAPLLERPGVGLIHPSEGNLVDDLIACLVRPGFVHRACRREGDESLSAPVVPRRPRSRAIAQVVLDGRCLSYPVSGTQVQLIGLVGGLVRAGANIAILGPPALHPTIVPVLGSLRTAVPFVERDRVGWPAVFHRPFQIGSLDGLADCLSIGKRFVLTHQDMIVDRTPAYATSHASWLDFRTTTSAALSSADEIGFFSRHAALDAASDGGLELDRATVVTLGVDHLGHDDDDGSAADPLRGRPYVLVLGNAYWHKNRLFALRAVRWLVEQHGWDGGLVLAGGHPDVGSSARAEEALLREASSLRGRVADLSHVSHAEQGALYRGAALVLFPSLYEGFGFIPFEAAAWGKACVYSHRASMRELLPDTGALPSYDLDEAGAFVLGLLESPDAREGIVEAIREAAAGLTWDRAAAGYLEVYRRALDREPRGISRLLLPLAPSRPAGMSPMETLVLEVYRRRRGFRAGVDATIRAGGLVLRGTRRARRRGGAGG